MNIHENCKLCQQTTLYTHYQVRQKKFHFYQQVKYFPSQTLFSHHSLLPHTHIHTQTKIHELCNEFGTVWLHQNVTHWTAFSLDFPVAQ